MFGSYRTALRLSNSGEAPLRGQSGQASARPQMLQRTASIHGISPAQRLHNGKSLCGNVRADAPQYPHTPEETPSSDSPARNSLPHMEFLLIIHPLFLGSDSPSS